MNNLKTASELIRIRMDESERHAAGLQQLSGFVEASVKENRDLKVFIAEEIQSLQKELFQNRLQIEKLGAEAKRSHKNNTVISRTLVLLGALELVILLVQCYLLKK